MKLLFVCTGNTCRSPMAEAAANKIFKDKNMKITASSAGVSAAAGCPASKNAAQAAAADGLDLKCHISKQVTAELLTEHDLVLTMTPSHKQWVTELKPDTPVFTISEYAGDLSGSISDPFGGSLDVYSRCYEQIKSKITIIADKLAKGDS